MAGSSCMQQAIQKPKWTFGCCHCSVNENQFRWCRRRPKKDSPVSHPMATGWRTARTSPAGGKFTYGPCADLLQDGSFLQQVQRLESVCAGTQKPKKSVMYRRLGSGGRCL